MISDARGGGGERWVTQSQLSVMGKSEVPLGWLRMLCVCYAMLGMLCDILPLLTEADLLRGEEIFIKAVYCTCCLLDDVGPGHHRAAGSGGECEWGGTGHGFSQFC